MIMSMVQRAAEVAAADEQVDGQTLADAFAATRLAAVRRNRDLVCECLGAVPLCLQRHDRRHHGTASRDTLVPEYNAIELVEGTEIRTTPVD